MNRLIPVFRAVTRRRGMTTLLIGHAAWWIIFLARVPPVSDEGFRWVEDRRPEIVETAEGMEASFSLMSHAPYLYLARRPLGGGWHEPLFTSLYMLLNLGGLVPALFVFNALEAKAVASARLSSDIATAAFFVGVTLQWFAIGRIFRVIRRQNATQSHVGNGGSPAK